MSNLVPINILDARPVPSTSPIVVHAAPGTDLWRKPPSTVSTNAPAYVTYHPISSFRRAQVTIDAKWDRLYDQGGLVLFLPSEGPSSVSHSSSLTTEDKPPERYGAWVKIGIEMFDGKPNVGVVATPAYGYSDWSLASTGTTSATIEAVRQKDGPGLYVYLIENEKKTNEKKKLIREVTWAFHGSDQGKLGVGVYAARPTKLDGETDGKGDRLSVHFQGLEIDWQ